jgi:hypothetical protein
MAAKQNHCPETQRLLGRFITDSFFFAYQVLSAWLAKFQQAFSAQLLFRFNPNFLMR